MEDEIKQEEIKEETKMVHDEDTQQEIDAVAETLKNQKDQIATLTKDNKNLAKQVEIFRKASINSCFDDEHDANVDTFEVDKNNLIKYARSKQYCDHTQIKNVFSNFLDSLEKRCEDNNIGHQKITLLKNGLNKYYEGMMLADAKIKNHTDDDVIESEQMRDDVNALFSIAGLK